MIILQFRHAKRLRNNSGVSPFVAWTSPTIPDVNGTQRHKHSPRSVAGTRHRANTLLRALLLAAGMLAGLTIAGCADSVPSTRSASSSETKPVAAGVPDALNFRASLVGGGEFDGARFVHRPVVFWFWAPT